MSIPLSLLIYNPIEAYILILLCDIVTGRDTKVHIRNVWILYLFGAINLAFQNIPNFWYGERIYTLISIAEAFVIHPIIINILYSKAFQSKITAVQSVVVASIQAIFVLTISNIFGLCLNNQIMFFNDDILTEFICNFVIFFVQISLYTFIKRKECRYEKYCKGNRK